MKSFVEAGLDYTKMDIAEQLRLSRGSGRKLLYFNVFGSAIHHEEQEMGL